MGLKQFELNPVCKIDIELLIDKCQRLVSIFLGYILQFSKTLLIFKIFYVDGVYKHIILVSLCIKQACYLYRIQNSLIVFSAPPDVTQYQYDKTSGYYYDPSTGLYYEPNTQVSCDRLRFEILMLSFRFLVIRKLQLNNIFFIRP